MNAGMSFASMYWGCVDQQLEDAAAKVLVTRTSLGSFKSFCFVSHKDPSSPTFICTERFGSWNTIHPAVSYIADPQLMQGLASFVTDDNIREQNFVRLAKQSCSC